MILHMLCGARELSELVLAGHARLLVGEIVVRNLFKLSDDAHHGASYVSDYEHCDDQNDQKDSRADYGDNDNPLCDPFFYLYILIGSVVCYEILYLV